MPAIINADDGVISGASGLKLSSDTSGALNIQTNGVTAIAISASQVVSFPATTTITFGSLNVTVLTSASATITNLIATSGSITTLTNNPTFGAGTANGMLYLNGSNVVTSGSAVVFNGTNMGIGGNPSSWQSGRTVLQITPSSTQGHLAFGGVISNISTNAFVDSTPAWKYIANGISALYQQDEGRHFWYTAASGTAGGAITWTQAMTLNASGNLGVGTTSPASRLDVTGAFGTGTTAFTIYNNSGASASNVARIDFRVNNTFNGNEQVAAIWGINPNAGGNNGGALVFATSANGTSTTPSECARIASDGSFGIGKSSPSYLLDIGNNPNTGTFIRAQGGFLVRRYQFSANTSTNITLRFTITMKNLEFTNFFLDLSSHKYDNGGQWEARRYAFQFMCEGSTVRLNQRMANYESGGSTATVFTVGNPPSWTFVSGQTHYFDITVAKDYVSYALITAEGPGISDATLAVV